MPKSLRVDIIVVVMYVCVCVLVIRRIVAIQYMLRRLVKSNAKEMCLSPDLKLLTQSAPLFGEG